MKNFVTFGLFVSLAACSGKITSESNRIGGGVQNAGDAPIGPVPETWTPVAEAPTQSVLGSDTQSVPLTFAKGVRGFRFKLIAGDGAACTSETGYSDESLPTSGAFRADLSSLPDGPIALCVVVRDENGHVQPFNKATVIVYVKDATPPVATLTGAPTGASQAAALDVTVAAGSDGANYRHKVIAGGASGCVDPAGYPAAPGVALTQKVTDSLTGFPEGLVTLCVVAGDAAGNWQSYSVASSASWVKGSLNTGSGDGPVAMMANAPTAISSVVTLDVAVSGVTRYRHKVVQADASSCTNATGYSAAPGTPVGTKISDSLTGFTDGLVTLCVIGGDDAGRWQSLSVATAATWIRDHTPPGTAGAITFVRNWQKVTPSWGAATGADLAGYIIVRREGAPVSFVPARGQSYTAGEEVLTGERVLYVGPLLTVEDPGRTQFPTYHYAVFSYDGPRNYAAASVASTRAGQFEPIATASPRRMHTGAWTGATGNTASANRLLSWGGITTGNNADVTDTGQIYNAATNSWSAMSTTGAPAARRWQSNIPIWTGNTGDPNTAYRMIVYGGVNGGGGALNTGGLYDPATDTWQAMTTTGAPARDQHAVVWTGNTGNAATANRMIVWGAGSSTPYIYKPASAGNDTWTAGLDTDAPADKSYATAVWTGNTGNAATANRMIVWGGFGVTNAGGIYDPSTAVAADAWTPTTTTGAPQARRWHTAVWTGSRMVVYGGLNGGGGALRDGGVYDPATDSWVLIPDQSPIDFGIQSMVAHWTGTQVLFVAWQTVRLFNPTTLAWTAPDAADAKGIVRYGLSQWTGDRMIMWGGEGPTGEGSIYHP